MSANYVRVADLTPGQYIDATDLIARYPDGRADDVNTVGIVNHVALAGGDKVVLRSSCFTGEVPADATVELV
ncbi:hypothetical protein H7J07_05750 [Mycobacterium koreense]|uniref:Uncharacterized protein n=1 Tax=Mycolicibacillus koreensis TaxID=1069220 RepID=A0A7I7SB42_9MYCO|nr:hypothetical protein [Mycolicibacillus koreensis]MCV7247729.1 hypothetical protein [Mycolicibacillus koreensis]OSC34743.1 hypothetical protein B8W67_05700 [Mycolicibacillus koreensis]BBY54114.1 hypothetical protein MKOR_13650 [Mycolicibacillus koreensis]